VIGERRSQLGDRVIMLDADDDVTALWQSVAHDAEGDSHRSHGTRATGGVTRGPLPRAV
jgi:hypothetical protein